MADYHRTEGFVIGKKDFREADQLFNVYTKDFGRLKILGRSIRKINSKLRSGIDVFYFSEIEFIQGRHYKTLTDALKIERFDSIRNDLNKLKISYKILEAVGSFIRCEEKDDNIFDLLKDTFARLNGNLPSNRYPLVYYYFLWNLFSVMGYQIDLYNCVLCHRKLAPVNLCLDCEKGGIICSDCSQNNTNGKSIFPETIKILRLFLEKNWDIIDRLKINEEHKKYLNTVSSHYFNNIKNCISYQHLL